MIIMTDNIEKFWNEATPGEKSMIFNFILKRRRVAEKVHVFVYVCFALEPNDIDVGRKTSDGLEFMAFDARVFRRSSERSIHRIHPIGR